MNCCDVDAIPFLAQIIHIDFCEPTIVTDSFSMQNKRIHTFVIFELSIDSISYFTELEHEN